MLLEAEKQFENAINEAKVAIEVDPNFAAAYSRIGFGQIALGHAAESIAPMETALRLSPRDPLRYVWEYGICRGHSHMVQWDKAAEWCGRSIATFPGFWLAYVDLAAANAWLGHEAEAKAALTGLLELKPGFTVAAWSKSRNWSENPTFQREFDRITQGLRKAGLPEE